MSVAVEEHLRLVGYNVAELMVRLPPGVTSRDDLVGAGALALVQAARAFDPGRGVPFERYASRRIKGSLVDELRRGDWAPRRARGRGERIHRVGSLDGVDVEYTGLSPEDAVLRGELVRFLHAACDALPPRLRLIIDRRYFQGVSNDAVAAEMGVSASYVSELHGRALGLLRAAFLLNGRTCS